jgi:hypothetical protein
VTSAETLRVSLAKASAAIWLSAAPPFDVWFATTDYVSSGSFHSAPVTHANADNLPLSKPHSKSCRGVPTLLSM